MLKDAFIKANKEELDFYYDFLYPIQDKILFALFNKIGDAVYLTGGTCLSRFYFHHRLSEDLDLFTIGEDVRYLSSDIVKVIEDIGFKVDIESKSRYFARLFVGLPEREEKLKVDIINEVNHYGEIIKTEKGFYIDNVENIAVNKITAFEDRAEVKDITDLFYIVKEYGLDIEKLFDLADEKREPIPYEGLLTINQEGLKGKVSIVKDVDIKEVEEFLRELKSKAGENIKKKEENINPNVIIRTLLWDFPLSKRTINVDNISIIKRRYNSISLPAKNKVEKLIKSFESKI